MWRCGRTQDGHPSRWIQPHPHDGSPGTTQHNRDATRCPSTHLVRSFTVLFRHQWNKKRSKCTGIEWRLPDRVDTAGSLQHNVVESQARQERTYKREWLHSPLIHKYGCHLGCTPPLQMFCMSTKKTSCWLSVSWRSILHSESNQSRHVPTSNLRGGRGAAIYWLPEVQMKDIVKKLTH